MWIIGFIIMLVVVYIGASMYFKYISQFEYKGLLFTKEKQGKLQVYHYYYYIPQGSDKPIQYNLYLLHDPRYNNVSIEGDKVLFDQRTVYVGVNSDYPLCKDNVAALVDLTSFLRANKFAVTVGFMNETYANETGSDYVTCYNHPDVQEVVELFAGNETKIVVEGNCHRISIGPECMIREAVEKFKVESLVEARNRSGLS